MNVNDAVRLLVALRSRLPEANPDADEARNLLDQLADATEDREHLVWLAVPVLLRINAARATAIRVEAGLGAAQDVDYSLSRERLDPDTYWTTGSGRRRGGAAEPEASPGDESPRDPGTIRRTPHLDIDPAGPIAVGDELTVSVYVDRQDLREGEHGAELVLPALEELTLGVTLIASSHFTVDEPDRTITVRSAEERSTIATFTLTCVAGREGNPGVAASFMYEWRPAGSVWRELDVEGVDAEPRKLPEPVILVDPAARASDLVVRVLPSPDGDERHFEVTITTPHLDEYRTPGVTVPWRLPSGTKQFVDGYMAVFTTSAPGGRKAGLIGAGRDLFLAAPQKFQEAVRALVNEGKPLETIFVVTSEPFIPWELMIPDVGPRTALGVQCAVGRWVHPQGTTPEQLMPIVDSYVIAPRYRGDMKLDFSADEADWVVDNFNGTPISPARLQTISLALSDRATTLLHFVCHGLDSPGGQILALDNDERLNEVQLLGLAGVEDAVKEKTPFVFINACEAGRPAPTLVGTGGFAARFTAMGARCVVAPIWSVKDKVAGTLARTFYERVKADPHLPYAEALRDLRKLAYEGDDPEDSWAAYCFYGDPRAAQEID